MRATIEGLMKNTIQEPISTIVSQTSVEGKMPGKFFGSTLAIEIRC